MQKLLSLLFIIIFIFSCNRTSEKADKKNALGDTIQTSSGLKYYYLKRGDGKKIEKTSKVSVYTDLYMNDSDSVFWTTSTAADFSTFKRLWIRSRYSFTLSKSPARKWAIVRPAKAFWG